jgi:peptidoglycan/xylan/chitin deacetylase (PgdA/CDA1 family)
LTVQQFDLHLRAIAGSDGGLPVTTDALTVSSMTHARSRSAPPVLLTFDDGGVCAAEHVAGALEMYGWRGHFFITTAYIDRPGFLSRGQIRALRRRGHVIGSHTHTHPLRMGESHRARQQQEWTRSVALLADLLGEPVCTASVPGGQYTVEVARTAAIAGVRLLFTSRPVTTVRALGPLLVLGRYSVRRSTSPATAGAIARGQRLPWLRQAIGWQSRSVAKRVGGAAYDRVRARLLGRSPQMAWGEEPGATSEEAT